MTYHYATLEQARQTQVAPWDELVADLDSVKVFADRYPVTIGHRLFVPKNNTIDNIIECFREAIEYGQNLVQNGGCDAYNIGMNIGSAAGQTVMYPHVHLIPRRVGDSPNPTGGVRGVIFGQQDYKSSGYQTPK